MVDVLQKKKVSGEVTKSEEVQVMVDRFVCDEKIEIP